MWNIGAIWAGSEPVSGRIYVKLLYAEWKDWKQRMEKY